MRIVRLHAEHLAAIRDALQPAQAHLRVEMDAPGYAAMLVDGGPAFAVLVDERVIAVGGVLDDGRGKATAWSLLAADAGPHMRRLTRAVRGFFAQGRYRRIEIVVRADHAEGQRWARLLGFQHEGTLRRFAPDGADYDMFSIIKEADHG